MAGPAKTPGSRRWRHHPRSENLPDPVYEVGVIFRCGRDKSNMGEVFRSTDPDDDQTMRLRGRIIGTPNTPLDNNDDQNPIIQPRCPRCPNQRNYLATRAEATLDEMWRPWRHAPGNTVTLWV